MSDLKERLDRELARVLPAGDARAAVDTRVARRRRRRAVLLPAVTLILTAGLVVGLTYAFTPDPPLPPADERVIGMPGEPREAMVDGDVLWVLTSDPACEGAVCDGHVVRVDTIGGEVTARVPVRSPHGIALAAGSLWVASFADGTLIRLDPATARIEETIPLVLPGEEPDSDWEFLPFDLDADEEGVWVSTARGAVAHIDPATNRVDDVVPLPPEGPGGVAIGREAVWIENSLGGLFRVDPETHHVEEEGSIDDDIGRRLFLGAPVARGGTLWLVGNWARPVEELGETYYEATERQALVEIDERTGEVASILDLRKEATWVSLLTDGDIWLVEGDGASLRRLDPLTGDLAKPIPVPFGRPLAISGRTAWSAVGESIRRWGLPDASSDPDLGEEPSRVMCDYPSVRPTYLPWLDPGEPLPEPEMTRWPERGGAGLQDPEPAYSNHSWSNGDVKRPGSDPDVGTVRLSRSTLSVGSFPVDPGVPPLPDGSTGGLFGTVGEPGDWSIVWGDPTPDVTDDDCSETSLVVSFPNLTRSETRKEIIRIAESLVTA